MAVSTYPVVLAGQRITAALLNNMLPLTVIKPSDETVTSSTTLQNDNDLVSFVVANGTYIFELYLCYEGGTQGSSDLKLGWSVPSGTLLRAQLVGQDTSGNPYVAGTQNQTSNPQLGTAGSSVIQEASMRGTIMVSTTAGNVQLKWAQGTSSGTGTIVHVGSYLQLTRVS